MANSVTLWNHKDTPRRDLFAILRFLMKFTSMYPLELEDYLPRFAATAIEIFLEIFTLFALVHITVLYVCTLYILQQEDADLELQVNCFIQLVIYLWAIGMKVFFRRIESNLLVDLIESINKEYKTRSAAGLTYVTMNEALALSNKYMLIFAPCCFSGTVFWSLLPLINGDRNLPLSCWYPIDTKAPITYEVLYILQFIAQMQVSGAFSASSGLHMTLAILISGQYDILHCSLKNIIATSYIRMGLKQEDLLELDKKQKIANLEQMQYYCATEYTDDYATHSQLTNSEKPQSFTQAFRASLKDCVTHHRYILRNLEKMEKFYNFLWLVKSGEVTSLICLVAFVSVKSTEDSSPMKLISLAQYLFLVVWELFIICYFAEIIFQNSQRCGEALMRSPWYLHMRETKQDILFFSMNSNRAFTLTAWKIYNLDINRFRAIITTSFSFFTILQKMDQRN